MVRCFVSLLISSGVFVTAGASLADDNPFWNLVHDRAVVADLKLTDAQRGEWHAVLDPLDLQVFPLRNQRADAAQPALAKIVDQARAGLSKVLTPKQNARLEAIRVRVLGVRALRNDKVAQQLKLSEMQREKLAAIIDEHDSARAEVQKTADEKPADDVEKERSRISTEERAAVQKLLTADQLTRLRS
ncbi:MAG TPA: hypothetical protein VFV87_09275, partial [Pirellulaceae bacterium]|nr:hypothetical protein [Pirellulaceae bacterium]